MDHETYHRFKGYTSITSRIQVTAARGLKGVKSNMFFELNLQLARSSQIKCSMHANQCSKP